MPLGIAYREWLLDLARVEAGAGCPRLFAMKSEIATYFADIAEDWSPERRHHFLRARIKWLCTDNYGYPAIPVSDGEKAADATWDYPWFGRDHGLGPYRSPGRPGAEFTWVGGKKTVVDADKVRALQRYVGRESGAFKIDRKLLRGAIKEAMKSSFGAPVVSGTGWQYATQVAGLVVLTNLDFGGRAPSQLRYSQWVQRPKVTERNVPLLEHGGVDTLLGWPQTEWCYLTDTDIPEAADLLVRLCGEFIEAVPGMWERSGLAGGGGGG